jgi:hypothetical protein
MRGVTTCYTHDNKMPCAKCAKRLIEEQQQREEDSDE